MDSAQIDDEDRGRHLRSSSSLSSLPSPYDQRKPGDPETAVTDRTINEITSRSEKPGCYASSAKLR